MTSKVASVIVTYNRLSLLKECIDSIRNQTFQPDKVIVVNNNSTDGTREWLDEQTDLWVIHQENLGGAGGFHRGIKEAYNSCYDWFWCMDDDTISLPDTLEKLVTNPYFIKKQEVGYLSSIVKWVDGSIHYMNMHPSAEINWYGTVLENKCVSITTTSFVSILINRIAVAKVGLPIKEFFIWHDDIEYTQRISKYFRNYYVLDSIAIHKTPSNSIAGAVEKDASFYRKKCYGLRNKVAAMKLLDESTPVKFLKITTFILKNSFYILKSKAPINLLFWMVSGLFFPINVEMVESSRS
jgi:GT2 family glycosyltransferase